MSPSPPSPPVLDQVVAQLSQELGVNLYSCCLYGSAVRGNAIAGVSDLNILIVLGESNAAAHAAVARALEKFPDVDPFVLGRRGFERSMRAFAPKFASIRRNYRVLAGADPLAGFQVDPPLERFLCEQALRNLRLRLAYSFITRKRHEAYDRYLRRQVTPIFLGLSEAARLADVKVPKEFEARVPALAATFSIDGAVLTDLLALRRTSGRLTEADVVAWHQRVFPVLDAVIAWMESKWPA
jgi:hypothetical protein